MSWDDAAGLRRIIDHLGPGIFVALSEPDGRLLMVNRPAMEVGEVREEDVIGRPIYETAAFTHSAAVVARAREAVERAGAGEPQRFDLELMGGGGRLMTVDLSIVPVRDDRGEVIYLVTSCFDITQRVEAHAELQQNAAQDLRAQRLASIGITAGGIAHDLNNVLAPIVMSIDLLRGSVTSDDDRVLVDAISSSAKRGADMVRQMVSFARGMEGVLGVTTPTPVSERTERPRGRGETILIVDDELSIRRVTKQTLEANGYRVLTAADGSEGLALYRSNRQSIAAVVTDMMMPVMDGATLMDGLLSMDPELPIIASSGFAAPAPDAVLARVRAVLSKPYTTETLLVTLRDVLPG